MDSDALANVRSRYKAAFDAYQKCADRNALNLSYGYRPTEQDLADEAQAMKALAEVRREWLDATAVVSGSRPRP